MGGCEFTESAFVDIMNCARCITNYCYNMEQKKAQGSLVLLQVSAFV